ncbi:phosphoenolpyruvate--protein phosphotransferase [Dermabacteraceae bacterium TAE3-ERU5]|nr:phosphoenolpyruvate--protein phosphotransferase [Dermabacteraceae bacterium TAE3-ERU5]
MTGTEVELLAPLTGIMLPIESVPDPVFAKKMVGDGFSIDPLVGELRAPADGEVVDLQASQHAVTLRTENGLEVLMHIGLETVAMEGNGFFASVRVGDRVKAGDLLISFDLDTVAQGARSVLTQTVVANMDTVASIRIATGNVTAGKDVAAYVTLSSSATSAAAAAVPAAAAAAAGGAHAAASAAPADAPEGIKVAEAGPVVVPNPTGLHARPAATLVSTAKEFASDVRIKRGSDSANAKSIVSIMSLGVANGEELTVEATGPDAEEAAQVVADAIRGGLGEDCGNAAAPVAAAAAGTAAAGAAATAAAQEPTTETGGLNVDAPAGLAAAASTESVRPRSGDENLLVGVSASPGLAVGTVFQVRREEVAIEEHAADAAAERSKLNAAIDAALYDLRILEKKVEAESGAERAAIFGAHQEILGDPDLLDRATVQIAEGKSAAYAWRASYIALANQLEGLDNEVLAGRAVDVRDVGQRVLDGLTGTKREAAEMPEGTVLIADDLTPSDTAQLDRSKVVGFATVHGGASSHVAIIARSLDLPAVAGIEERATEIADGSRVVLDGTAGTLRKNVSEEQIAEIQQRQARMAAAKAEAEAHKDEPAVTKDGHRIQVVANIGNAQDARDSQGKGGEGVGLLRSEFVFMERRSAPSETEQAEVYSECARALAPGQPLIVRTLDVGGDKPLAYLPIPHEENPFLGVRGVRVGLEKPEILRTQIRAILSAADAGAKMHIMFPMIATIADWRQAKAIFDEERAKHPTTAEISVGIMMEVPSVAVMATQFANEEGCDFFSVGTNDLTSYTLAMDRGHPKLASQVDPLNPAVLSLIHNAAGALHRKGKWLGVCGGVASDPQAVPILIGLGVDELSCSIPAIPEVKASVRAYSLDACKELAARALTCATAEEVRALVPVDNA